MEENYLYFFEIRKCKKPIDGIFNGSYFVSHIHEHDWTSIRVIKNNENEAIEEILSKINTLKDKE